MPGPPNSTAPKVPLSDKVTAGLTLLATNTAVTAAPLIHNIDPGINPDGAGGPVVAIIAGFINALIQAFKMHDWYQQNKWAAWTIILLGFVICLFLWHDNMRLGVLNAFATISNSLTSYQPLNKLGVLTQGTDPVEVS